MENKIIDVSILIKTFIRPQCLDNLLNSIKEYQEKHNIHFQNIVIIDDSDEKHTSLNTKVVEKYCNFLDINYKSFPFNSLGLSKGRNIGIKEIHSKYFILCDDDFIFDEKCMLLDNINLLEEKNIDILGGFYRDIKSIDDNRYTDFNWLGYITENENFDLCLIFSDLFPEFCYCDIVENFYIAKTSCFEKIQYPEDLPMLEHNVFFLRAKQQGLKVGFTKELWTKHLHINNSDKNYQEYRNRTVINPIEKNVIGYHFNGKTITRFYDYLHVSSNEIYKKYEKKQKPLKKVCKFIKNIKFKI